VLAERVAFSTSAASPASVTAQSIASKKRKLSSQSELGGIAPASSRNEIARLTSDQAVMLADLAKLTELERHR
jgi:hypothetical protein